MKLILTHEVTGLGAAGDIVEVKDGYGRNFLMPRGLATPWTKGGQKQVDALTKGRAVREIKDLDTAKGVKGQLEATSVKVPAKAGQSGRLFGAVSNGDIAEVMNTTVSAVESLLKRGRQQLREILRRHEPDILHSLSDC